MRDTRAVAITPKGAEGFAETFGVRLEDAAVPP
jgi:hypothetical protein